MKGKPHRAANLRCPFDGQINSQGLDGGVFDGPSQLEFTWQPCGAREAVDRRIQVLWLSLALFTAAAVARAEVQVTFTAPENYVDAGLRRENGARAREVILRTIREQLVSLGERYLAPNRTLKFEVLDIDLAGELEWWHGPNDIRYLRGDTWPKIRLRYTLEEGGQSIGSGEELVSDPSYRMNVIVARSGEIMPYEKEMLARWFRSRFAAG